MALLQKRPRLKQPIIIFGVFFLWALVLTFPLILHPTTHIPQGQEQVGTVPFFNLWTLQWNIDQLFSGYDRYWDAPIFAPTMGTFAFSEMEWLSGVLAAPIWLATQSPGLAYNSLIVLFLILNGWFLYWLAQVWGVPPGPALWAGLLGQSMPFVAQEMGVLQLVAVFGFLWPLYFLDRFLRVNGRRFEYGLALALGLPTAFYTCSYYGFFSLLFLPLAFVHLWRPQQVLLKRLLGVAIIGLVSLSLILPVLLKQNAILAANNLQRSEQTVSNNSARLSDYAQTLDSNWLYGQLLQQKGTGQRLFPGLGLLLLAGFGLFGAGAQTPRPGAIKLYLILAVILALALSLGLNLQLGSWHPYHWLREAVPGFAQLRSPFRFAVFTQLHLVLLAGFGLGWLRRRLPSILTTVVAGLAVIEMLALPLPLQPLPQYPVETTWPDWLQQQDGRSRIVRVPFAASPRVADFEQTTRWMLEQRSLSVDMVNGYSGFFSMGHRLLRERMAEFPSAESLDQLRELGVDYAVVDHRLPQTLSVEAMQTYLPLSYYDTANHIGIYDLRIRREE